jgi:8-oxo-dGTP diphosphatase
MSHVIQVAVGVLIDDKHCVLLARRLKGTHLAGFWEFPGGKVEAGETVKTALGRELLEELGITVDKTSPLLTVSHDYGEKQVLLDVHRVEAWSGEPFGAEGQPIAWVDAPSLSDFQVPDANAEIMTRVAELLNAS